MTRDWYARYEGETQRIGAELARLLRAPALIILEGDLGAGKTTLMKGVVEALNAGAAEDVTSPTFTLVHEYSGPDVRVFHLDVYRLKHPAELDGLGFDEMLEEPGAMVFVEWGEKFPSVTQRATHHLLLQTQGTGRAIQLQTK